MEVEGLPQANPPPLALLAVQPVRLPDSKLGFTQARAAIGARRIKRANDPNRRIGELDGRIFTASLPEN
jgi:hypothetical protein